MSFYPHQTRAHRVVTRYLEGEELKTKIVGTCGFCERPVKCPEGELALHGYKRPGYGSVHGKCPGSRHKPWEVSPETGKMALDYYTQVADKAQRALDQLPKAEVLQASWHRKPTKKLEATDWEWQRAYEETELDIKKSLSYALRDKKHFQELVQAWKPTQTTSVNEIAVKKRERAEEVKKVRLDRYTTEKDKTVARIQKAYQKLLSAEAALNSARDPDKIVKAMNVAASSAATIYEIAASKAHKLADVFPGQVTREFVLKDLNLDDIFQHLGILTGTGYISSRDSDEARSNALGGDQGESLFLWKGLDHWAPFWPGWKGTIHYPEGSTGESRNRHHW